MTEEIEDSTTASLIRSSSISTHGIHARAQVRVLRINVLKTVYSCKVISFEKHWSIIGHDFSIDYVMSIIRRVKFSARSPIKYTVLHSFFLIAIYHHCRWLVVYYLLGYATNILSTCKHSHDLMHLIECRSDVYF